MAFLNGFSRDFFQFSRWCQLIISVLCCVGHRCKAVTFQLGPQRICCFVLCSIPILPLCFLTKWCTVPPTVATANCEYTNIFIFVLQAAYFSYVNTLSYPDLLKTNSVLNFHFYHSSISPYIWQFSGILASGFRFELWSHMISECLNVS